MKELITWTLLTGAACLHLYHTNTSVEVEPIVVKLRHLGIPFQNAKIVVISDVHLPHRAAFLSRLCKLVALQKPDYIFLTGDLLDSYSQYDWEGLEQLAGVLARMAPCFAVAGNHEKRIGMLTRWTDILTCAGITVLHDRAVTLYKSGAALTIYGVLQKPPRVLPATYPRPVLALAHQPEKLTRYAEAKLDLVVCGHAHGGQFRVGKQGLYAPNQGVLPAYTSGRYVLNRTQMVVSRGLGNSSFPLRLHNRLHLPVLILQKDEDAAD